MTTQTDQCIGMGITAACGFILNPWACIGALAGCCFFLAMPSTTQNLTQRMLLSFFSWVMGYAAGAYLYPGPPWSQEAMLVSAAAAWEGSCRGAEVVAGAFICGGVNVSIFR